MPTGWMIPKSVQLGVFYVYARLMRYFCSLISVKTGPEPYQCTSTPPPPLVPTYNPTPYPGRTD
ncbi:hypothetical protein PmNV_031 [Penaeus monodon nudivirus]|uniref:Uncharacterized protein n=1 Tax=Penaeus monodon nudivirus TaxID=1529056 RepID=A0A076FEL2_9VIRU|nr:hypothetical protein PmNV_031 [Penaeus monodon nudivirus]AII15819.1 hypothetical protein PmNV_031 [Penaeus monodon nudivirus]